MDDLPGVRVSILPDIPQRRPFATRGVATSATAGAEVEDILRRFSSFLHPTSKGISPWLVRSWVSRLLLGSHCDAGTIARHLEGGRAD
jgi:hypothetical protein